MKRLLVAALLLLLFLPGCSAAQPAHATPQPGWILYANEKYGYEIQYPDGCDLWPTGPEGERDGASIRIGVKDRQAPVPVLDIQVEPRTPEAEFADAFVQSSDLRFESETVLIGKKPAKELTLYWKSNNEIAFVIIYLKGVVFQFSAEAGLQDFHASPWWEIISTFRLTGA
jgi:hypothetical protein